jgi:ABC-type multidrug transport system ATPase subunit
MAVLVGVMLLVFRPITYYWKDQQLKNQIKLAEVADADTDVLEEVDLGTAAREFEQKQHTMRMKINRLRDHLSDDGRHEEGWGDVGKQISATNMQLTSLHMNLYEDANEEWNQEKPGVPRSRSVDTRTQGADIDIRSQSAFFPRPRRKTKEDVLACSAIGGVKFNPFAPKPPGSTITRSAMGGVKFNPFAPKSPGSIITRSAMEGVKLNPFAPKPSDFTISRISELSNETSNFNPSVVGGDGHDDDAYFHVYRPPKTKVDLGFENLRLTVDTPAKTLTIVDGVSGSIPAGSSVAIMGESGAGKTSLLNVLCGRAHYGTTTGVVKINGDIMPIHTIASCVGFVPQDDIVHDTLTVYENLYFSARFRSEDGVSLTHIDALVEETLKVLLLDPIRDSVVGSVEKRGISGGQRKRVNIGLEIVAEPALIFLDEPTSGLDATSSQLVMSALAKLGDVGVSTASVIHQPRYDVFCGFDLLFLLGKGGKMVYQGPPKASKEYFENLGFEMRPTDNLGDFVCDVTCAAIPRRGHPDFKPPDLFDLWIEHQNTVGDSNPVPRKVSKHLGIPKLGVGGNKSFWQQVKLQFLKEGLKRARNFVAIVGEWALCGLVVLFGGILLGPYRLKLGGNIFDIETSVLITLLLYGIMLSYIFAKTFTADKLIFWRECGRDYYIAAFFIAQVVMDLGTVVIAATLAACFYNDFRQPWLPLGFVWLWFVIVTFGWSGWSYFFSTLFPLKTATIMTILANTMLNVLLSGTVPFLKPEAIFTELPFLGFISTGFMGADSYLVSFANQLPVQYGLGNKSLDAKTTIKFSYKWGYAWYSNPDDYDAPESIFEPGTFHWPPLYIILAQGIVLRLLAILFLSISNRGAMGKPPLCTKKEMMALLESRLPEKTVLNTSKSNPKSHMKRQSSTLPCFATEIAMQELGSSTSLVEILPESIEKNISGGFPTQASTVSTIQNPALQPDSESK